jgi:hypothetical protein
MRNRLLLALLVAAVVAPVADARAGSTAVVGATRCALDGGTATVAAGSTVTVRWGWAAASRGLVEDFLRAQQTTISVNGAPAADISGSYQAPSGNWRTDVFYPTGVMLAAGKSLTFTLRVTTSHRLHDGLAFEESTSGKPRFAEAGTLFAVTCTLTGA